MNTDTISETEKMREFADDALAAGLLAAYVAGVGRRELAADALAAADDLTAIVLLLAARGCDAARIRQVLSLQPGTLWEIWRTWSGGVS